MPMPVIWEKVRRHHSGAPRAGFAGVVLLLLPLDGGGGVGVVCSIVSWFEVGVWWWWEDVHICE